MTVTPLSLDGVSVKSLYPRYCQWQHTIYYMVACWVESQLKPQTECLKRFRVGAVLVYLNVTEKYSGDKSFPSLFSFIWMFVCCFTVFLKVKGQWNSFWSTDVPLGVKSNFEHRGHSRATPGLLHLKTNSISVVRPWNLGLVRYMLCFHFPLSSLLIIQRANLARITAYSPELLYGIWCNFHTLQMYVPLSKSFCVWWRPEHTWFMRNNLASALIYRSTRSQGTESCSDPGPLHRASIPAHSPPARGRQRHESVGKLTSENMCHVLLSHSCCTTGPSIRPVEGNTNRRTAGGQVKQK